jgi:hypothetical protein
MLALTGPSHCLQPKFWKEWAEQQNINLESLVELVQIVIENDLVRGYVTMFDLTPAHFRKDYEASSPILN